MAKFAKKGKNVDSAKKIQTPTGNRTRAAENVSCLLELHKLQGVLLNQLSKEVR